jgi:DNA-binding NtrC family response regulator
MKSKVTILIIDDDPLIAGSLTEFLELKEYRVFAAQNGKAGRHAFQTHHPSVVLLDQELPDTTGLDVCRDLLEIDPSAKIIFITAHASVRYAVDTMQAGAFNYLPKPFSLDELLIAIHMAEKSLRLEGQLKVQEYKNKQQAFTTELVGHSNAAERLRGQIQMAAASDAAVLITGETGVGKNLIAKEIHQRQNRRDSFLTINCSAIPESLMEAEYFGHEKGAFTGADTRREGIFELTDGGTLLLDEIGDIPYRLQSKLLSVLEEKQVRRIGGAQPIHVDVRIVALTNQDLAAAIRENRFREDLFYRLAVIQINVPPLRRHAEDIPAIATYFAQKFCGTDVTIPEAQLNRLAAYAWPGNVRELRNIIERASLLRQGDTIRPADLLVTAPLAPPQEEPTKETKPVAEDIVPLEELTKQHILRALDACSGNKSQAAKCLGLSLSTLKRKIKSFT